MPEEIRICTDAVPPHGDFELLAHLARTETEENAPDARLVAP